MMSKLIDAVGELRQPGAIAAAGIAWRAFVDLEGLLVMTLFLEPFGARGPSDSNQRTRAGGPTTASRLIAA